MARDITISTRELSPFERLVLELVCEGKSNGAIATETSAYCIEDKPTEISQLTSSITILGKSLQDKTNSSA